MIALRGPSDAGWGAGVPGGAASLAAVSWLARKASGAWRFADEHPVLAVFALALAVRSIVALTVFIGWDGWLFGDDLRYSVLAQAKADGSDAFASLSPEWGPALYLDTLYDGTSTLLMPITALYWVFGPVKLIAQLFVAVLGAGAAAVTARLALEFLSRHAAVVAGAIVALMPSQVLFSSLILKDAAVWLVMASIGLLVALALRAEGRRLAYLAAGILVLLLALGNLRDHTLVIACWGVGLAALAGVRQGRLLRLAGALATMALVPMAFGLGVAGKNNFSGATIERLGFQRAANAVAAETAIEKDASAPEEAPAATPTTPATTPTTPTTTTTPTTPTTTTVAPKGSAPPTVTGSSTTPAPAKKPKPEALRKPPPTPASTTSAPATTTATAPPADTAAQDAAAAIAEASRESVRERFNQQEGLVAQIKHLPRGVSVVLLEPYPWQGSGNLSIDLARGETLFWYPVLLLGLIGLLSLRARHLRTMAFPVLTGGAVLLIYALTEGNIGTAIRHRGELLWPIALLAALGGFTLVERFRARR